MTAQQALKEAADQLKKNPQEYIAYLMQFSDKVLERKLDVTREQKKMALERQKMVSFDLLHIKEELIIQVRFIKSDKETYVKLKKKTLKRKDKKNEIDITNSLQVGDSQDTELEVRQNDKAEQLLLDF